MALPIQLSNIKSSGVYRFVIDKSEIPGDVAPVMRLVVGYSEIGPFNTPVYIENEDQFKKVFGDINKRLERYGVFFHRLALEALEMGPIYCLNLKTFTAYGSGQGQNTDPNKIEYVDAFIVNPNEQLVTNSTTTPTTLHPAYGNNRAIMIENLYDTNRFWVLRPEHLVEEKVLNPIVENSTDHDILEPDCSRYVNNDRLITVTQTDTDNMTTTIFMRRVPASEIPQYDSTFSEWYNGTLNGEQMPDYMVGHENDRLNDYFGEIWVFRGDLFSNLTNDELNRYTDVDGTTGERVLNPTVNNAFDEPVNTLQVLSQMQDSNFVNYWRGILLPNFYDAFGGGLSLDTLFNADYEQHHMMMYINPDVLYEYNDTTYGTDALAGLFTPPALPNNLTLSERRTANIAPITVHGPALAGNFYSVEDTQWEQLVASGIFASAGTPITDPSQISDNTYYNAINPFLNRSASSWNENEYDCYSVALYHANTAGAVTQYLGNTNTNIDQYINSDTNTIYATRNLLNISARTIGNSDVVITYDNDTQTYKLSCTTLTGIDTLRNILFTSDQGLINGSKTIRLQYGLPYECYGFVLYAQPITNSLETPYAYHITDIHFAYTTDTDNVVHPYMEFKCSSNIDTSITYATAGAINCGDGNHRNAGYTISNSGARMNISNFTPVGGRIEITNQQYNAITSIDNTFLQGTNEVYVYNMTTDSIDILPLTPDYEPPRDGNYIQIGPCAYKDVDENGNVTIYYNTQGVSTYEEEVCYIPSVIKGFTKHNARPGESDGQGVNPCTKLTWITRDILDALTRYKGLREALTNNVDLEYRYLVDTFDGPVCYDNTTQRVNRPDWTMKEKLVEICRAKDNVFGLLNYAKMQYFNKSEFKTNGTVDFTKVSAALPMPSQSTGSSWVAYFSQFIYQDPFTGVKTTVPSAAVVSNEFMRKYQERFEYSIVAGTNYGVVNTNGLIGPDYNFARSDRDILEPYGLNVLLYDPRKGTYVNSNKTAQQKPLTTLSSINVREVVIHIQNHVHEILLDNHWEFNTVELRNKVRESVEAEMKRVQCNSGVYDYRVVCDETNNTAEVIDNEMFIVDIAIEPTRGAGKMVQRLTLYRKGALASTTI